ncbi:GIY-YIG nuclease family protein [Pseudoneobacillus rhizosphaerae]|uniref:GIY-YIG domain-containing protein n=1 Tax=Pseudoneobacillus rhizosphaerae TaxID=2880968 RepID=A0A9C7L9E2_9BACI|nr:GIY-YIG nuclease family protein [Pseudoneobacillus rhizosphaerae]CAG9606882.1 hypothetical protein NEOCIP111885_00570 [Pseudoneobacillus rhizosphaerae]
MNYERFLIENGILPIERNWNHFRINHVKPVDEVAKNQVRGYIENNVANHNGLYIYKNNKGEILYIGKGKPLKNRLYSHFLESFQPVKGDTKDQRWHPFFLKHQGEHDVYWIELETEKDRQIIEKMLEYVLNPLFAKPPPPPPHVLPLMDHPLKPSLVKKENKKQNPTDY